MVFDASGSLEENFPMSLKLAKKIIYGLNFNGGGTQVGVVMFAENAAQKFQLNTYTTKEEVLNAVAYDLIGKSTLTVQSAWAILLI